MAERSGTDWFEPLYDRAEGDPDAVPWAREAPSPALLAWLDQPGLEVAGSDALVIGCGLGVAAGPSGSTSRRRPSRGHGAASPTSTCPAR